MMYFKENVLAIFFLCLGLNCLAQVESIPQSNRLFSNPDGSVTILEPKIARADKMLKVNGCKDKGRLGICALFGFSHVVDKFTLLADGKNDDGLEANLSENGTIVSITSGQFDNRCPIQEITCYNKLGSASNANIINENPDHSVTITDPRIDYGGRSLFFENTPNPKQLQAICMLFGLTGYYKDTVEFGFPDTGDYRVALSQNGLVSLRISEQVVSKLTCYNDASYEYVSPSRTVDDGTYSTIDLSSGVVRFLEGRFNEALFIQRNRKFLRVKEFKNDSFKAQSKSDR